MRRLLALPLLLAVLVAASGCGPTSAPQTGATAPLTPAATSADLAHAKRVARATWGSNACADVQVERVASLPGRVVGETRFTRDAAGYHCQVVLGPGAFVNRAYLCDVVVHEYGHLDGEGHSSDPASVMFPEVREPYFPACT